MTRDDSIRIAHETGFNPMTFMGAGFELFERFAALVAEAEREACAKAVEAEGQKYWGPGQARAACDDCAKTIRARGNK